VTRLSAEELESQNKLREAQMAATQESNEAISAGGSTDKMEAGSASGSKGSGSPLDGLMKILDPLGLFSGLMGGGKGSGGGGILGMVTGIFGGGSGGKGGGLVG
jgi:hypothetical protein